MDGLGSFVCRVDNDPAPLVPLHWSLHWSHTIPSTGGLSNGLTNGLTRFSTVSPLVSHDSLTDWSPSRAIGKPIRYTRMSDSAARAGMASVGMAPVMIAAMTEFLGERGRPLAAYQTTTIRDLTGREPRSFDERLNDHVAAFA